MGLFAVVPVLQAHPKCQPGGHKGVTLHLLSSYSSAASASPAPTAAPTTSFLLHNVDSILHGSGSTGITAAAATCASPNGGLLAQPTPWDPYGRPRTAKHVSHAAVAAGKGMQITPSSPHHVDRFLTWRPSDPKALSCSQGRHLKELLGTLESRQLMRGKQPLLEHVVRLLLRRSLHDVSYQHQALVGQHRYHLVIALQLTTYHRHVP
jgi:hypothetical protein